MAGMDELQRRGQEGLEPDRACCGFLEGQPLLLFVPGGVEGADDVDEPVGKGGDQRRGGHLPSAAAG